MKLFLATCLTLLTCQFTLAQSIDGYWKGRLVMEPGGCFPVYNIEFQVQVLNGNRITGTSYHYSDTSNYVKEEFEGNFDKEQNKIQIQEMKVSVFKIPSDCIPCIKNYTLSFHTDGVEEQLRGGWTGKTMDGKSSCPAGSIVLTRASKSDFAPAPPPIISNRTNDLVKEILVDTGSIRLDFYDNGQIDGDTISVYVNNQPIVSHQMLTAKPITITLQMDGTEKTKDLIMVGENLGSIPPNTALMIVHAGGKRYQLYLTSDEKKNSLVRFVLRE